MCAWILRWICGHPLRHFELGVFATPIGRSEMECAALGFS